MSRLISLALVPVLATLGGCVGDGAGSQDGFDTEATADGKADGFGSGGIGLKGSTGNTKLTIAITKELDPDENGGWDARLTHAFVKRQGVGSFDCYCSASGEIGANGASSTVSCTKYNKNQDHNLDFEVSLKDGQYRLQNVARSSTKALTKEYKVLVGSSTKSWWKLNKTFASEALDENPFAAPGLAADLLAPHLGAKAYDESTQTEQPIVGFSYRVDEYFGVSGEVKFKADEYGTSYDFTLLNERYELSSGFAALDVLAARVVEALPTAPVCQEDGPIGSATNPVPSIINAFLSPLSGPSFGLSHEVTLAQVPTAAKSAVQTAMNEIDNRSFEGSDYEASVWGIYAIHRSCANSSIVAYVVYGGGAGEPDYHDAIVIGIDLTGKRVHDEEEDG